MTSNTGTNQGPRYAWTSGEAYERWVGRWSRLVAREFVSWLAVPPNRRWLDVGCGTGILSREIVHRTQPAAVVGIDPSPAYVSIAHHDLDDAQTRFAIGDARAIPLAGGSCDVVISGLMLNFVPAEHQETAVSEMARVVKPGGLVAAYVWDYAGEMQLMRYFWDAAAELDPAARGLDGGARFLVCRPEPLTRLFRTAGLRQVEVRAIEVPTVFHDFADYWQPFLGGQGSAPGYVASLSVEQREALRRRLNATLPCEADGTIRLSALAWAVKGDRPD